MKCLRTIKKLRYFLLLLSVLLLFGNASVFAKAEGNVYDGASLLTDSEISSLNEKITALQQTSGWNIYAVTTDNAEGKTAKAYADDFFDAHSPEQEDGVALLIDMDNREIYLSTCGEAIRYLTDARLDVILDDAYGYAGNGNYADCLNAMVDGVAACYERGINRNQYNYDTETGKVSVYRSLTLSEIVVAVLVSLVAGGAFFGITVGKYRLKLDTWRYPFRDYGEVNLQVCDDRYINKFVTHRRIPRQTGNGGRGSSGGRSSTHRSSSGRSHGGSGRKF